MRNEIKKIVSVAVAAATAATVSVSAFAFTDTDSHWAKDYIDFAANSGWVNGYEDGSFKPDANIKRAEVAQVLVNMYNVTEETDQVLSDVSDDAWYASTIKKAVAAGYIQGDENSDGIITVRPEDDITRQEAFVIINRAAYPNETATATELPYSDADSVATWAVIATSTLTKYGRLAGYEDGTIRPEKKITRAEFAKLLGTIYDDKGENTITSPVATKAPVSNGLIGSGSSSGGSSSSGGGGGGHWVYPTTAPTTSPSTEPTTAPSTEPTATPTVAPTAAPTVAPAEVSDVAADVNAASKVFDNLSSATKTALSQAGITANPAANAANVSSSLPEDKKAEVAPILTPVYDYVIDYVKTNSVPVISDDFTNQVIVIVDAAANKVLETQDKVELTSYIKDTVYPLIDAEYANPEQNAAVKAAVKAVVLNVFNTDMTFAVEATKGATGVDYNWLTLREAFLKSGLVADVDDTAYLANFGYGSYENVLVIPVG